jgi:hypothetical protein
MLTSPPEAVIIIKRAVPYNRHVSQRGTGTAPISPGPKESRTSPQALRLRQGFQALS